MRKQLVDANKVNKVGVTALINSVSNAFANESEWSYATHFIIAIVSCYEKKKYKYKIDKLI